MNRHLAIALLFILSLLMSLPQLSARVIRDIRPELPLRERLEMQLDTLPLDGPEGLWEYPGDGVSVLIRRSQRAFGRQYAMTVVESRDPRLSPGDTVGWLRTSAPGEYQLTHYSRKNESILDLPATFSASLSSDGRALTVRSTGRLKISISPMSILPRFWRVVRLSGSNVGGNNHEGLRRIYPHPVVMSDEKIYL